MEENRPYLSRVFFDLPFLTYRTSGLERALFKKARLFVVSTLDHFFFLMIDF